MTTDNREVRRSEVYKEEEQIGCIRTIMRNACDTAFGWIIVALNVLRLCYLILTRGMRHSLEACLHAVS